MKKTRLTLAFAVAMTTLGLFGGRAQAQMNLGLFVGSSHFTVHQKVPVAGVDLDFKMGLAVGALVNYQLTDDISLQAEPMYLHKGAIANINGYGSADVRASYLEVPLMMAYEFREEGMLQPYVMAGPTFGYLLRARQTAPFIPASAERITERMNRWETGLTGGFGLMMPMGSGTAFVQGRYYHGLTDTHAEVENHKSRGLTFALGMSFKVLN